MAVAKDVPNFDSLREKDIAAAYHVDRRQVSNWVAKGCPINPDRSYSANNVKNWLIEREVKKYRDTVAGEGLGDQKTRKEIELLEGKIEKQNIEVDELKKNTVSKYLYNRAITTIIESFTKFAVDALKRNIVNFRAIPDHLLPAACDDYGIQMTKYMKQSVKIVEQREE